MIRSCTTALLLLLFAAPVFALDDEHWEKANDAIERGIAFLSTTQNEDGSWTPEPGPAITAMVAGVMLDRPDIATDDPRVAKALEYILSKLQPDGGIYDRILANYNTAIALSALSRVDTRPDAAEAVANGQRFLMDLQWHDQTDPDGNVIDESHPWYGGAGYGRNGRPDMSNTQIMLQGLYDSGVDCEDPAFQRALVFINRCQGVPSNELLGDRIEQNGGFIYATSVNKDNIDTPESKAGEDSDGRLRTYGSMTYAGFKSYVYAQLERDDPRVIAARDWLSANYTFDRNPGMPTEQDQQGLYYMYMTAGRALGAWGSTTVTTTDGEVHDWANDIISAIVSRQREDGSWANEEDRWMEDDPNLVTAYCLIALQAALR